MCQACGIICAQDKGILRSQKLLALWPHSVLFILKMHLTESSKKTDVWVHVAKCGAKQWLSQKGCCLITILQSCMHPCIQRDTFSLRNRASGTTIVFLWVMTPSAVFRGCSSQQSPEKLDAYCRAKARASCSSQVLLWSYRQIPGASILKSNTHTHIFLVCLSTQFHDPHNNRWRALLSMQMLLCLKSADFWSTCHSGRRRKSHIKQRKMSSPSLIKERRERGQMGKSHRQNASMI